MVNRDRRKSRALTGAPESDQPTVAVALEVLVGRPLVESFHRPPRPFEIGAIECCDHNLSVNQTHNPVSLLGLKGGSAGIIFRFVH